MRVRHLAALGAGLLLAFAIAGLPASAADESISALSPYGWNNPNRSIAVGESVTWTNPYSGSHNVCVRAAGATSGCAEFQLPATPTTTWPDPVKHTFTADGTYEYICQLHGNLMKGVITVGTGQNPPPTDTTGTGTGTGTNTGTGTGTSTTPPTGSQPTETITNPAETQATNTAPADTTKPAFNGSVKRRASRTALIVTMNSSEDASLRATVSRRPPRGRSFGRLSQKSVHVKQGKNVVTLMRLAKSRRSGAFRIKLQLVDAAGNKSLPKTLNFKIA